MALPVSCDQPIVAIMQYDPSSPPIIPAVSVLPQVNHLIPYITAAVINEAGLKASSNKARMLCYNLLVNNYWNNPSFNEVVKLVADALCVKTNKGIYRFPDTGVNETVKEILTLYTSSLVFSYPELKSIIDPQVLNVAYQNTPTLNALKQEINNMYNTAPGNMPHPGYPMGNQQPNMGGFAQTPMMGHPMAPYPQQGMHPQQGMVYNPHMQQPMGYPQQGMMQPMPMQQAPMGSNYPERAWASNTEPQSTFNSNDRFDIKQERYFTRANSEVRSVEHTHVPEPKPEVKEKEVKNDYLTVVGGSEMDRSKHQITFFDDSYKTDGAIRYRNYHESVERIKAVDVDTEHHDEANIYVSPTWSLDDCVDVAITSGQIKQYEVQKTTSGNSMFRCFAIVARPFISSEDVSGYMNSLKSADTFTSLAIKIKSLATSIEAKKSELENANIIISFLSRVDIFMTNMVNDFLTNMLIPYRLKIDSFSEDISALDGHLRKKNYLYAESLSRFEKDAIDILFNKLGDEALGMLEEAMNLPENVKFSYLTTNHSFTYTFMNDKELGYKVNDKAVIIDKQVAPVLYEVAHSLTKHKKQSGSRTLFDWFITADGVRYRLYKSDIEQDQYMIAKA